MSALATIIGFLALVFGGANWLVDYQNRGPGYPMRKWPPLATLAGIILLVI